MKFNLREFFKYFGGALSGLIVDWFITLFTFWISGSPILAQSSGKALGGVFAFFIYKHKVFKKDYFCSNSYRQSLKFIISVIFGFIVSVIAFKILISFSVPWVISKIISDGITFILNYFVVKHWVFK